MSPALRPSVDTSVDAATVARVQSMIDELRPYIRLHDGDVDFVGIHEGRVEIRMGGACIACPSLPSTLKDGIEQIIVREVPGIRGVTAVS